LSLHGARHARSPIDALNDDRIRFDSNVFAVWAPGRLSKNSLPGEPGMARGADQSLQVIDPTGANPDMRRTRDLRNAQDVRFSPSC
jgi:hypothetical protein